MASHKDKRPCKLPNFKQLPVNNNKTISANLCDYEQPFLYFCRKFLQDVMEETLGEVVDSRSFDSLVKAVNAEKEKKAGLQQTILK